jgi:hypothetical protein
MAKDKDHPPDDQEGLSPDLNHEAYQQASQTHCEIPPIDFTTFVLSLSTQALMQLGEVKDPDGQVAQDLMMARQTIDLLGLLESKTKGNLTGEEEQLLQQILYDLRMRFVATCDGNSIK